MKGLITPAISLAIVATYLCYEGVRLSVSDTAFALAASQSQQGQGAQQSLFDINGQSGKKPEVLGGGEMMEFEGDIFADVPEHVNPDEGVGEEDESDKASPGQRKG